MLAVERYYRTARTAFLAARVYGSYKIPRVIDRVRGADYKRRDLAPVHESNAWMIYNNAIALRGLMIKVCQVIGTRSDVFPPEYIKVLSQCHDAVPSRSFEEMAPVLEHELNSPIADLFIEFDREPIASASLAQVHRARLKSSGEIVAVKIQYPDIADIVRTDIGNMTRICAIYERLDPQPVELMPLLKEMQKHLEAAGMDPRDVVQELMRVYVTMILARGFFQADPHPGNIFVNPHRTTSGRIVPRFVLLDFGLSKELPEGFGYALFNLMFSMMTANEASMIRAFQELGFETKTGDPKTLVVIARAMNRQKQFRGEFTQEMTRDLFTTIRENPVVRVPTDFVLVGRAFSLLSGIAHTLGGEANVLNAMAPGSSDSGRRA